MPSTGSSPNVRPMVSIQALPIFCRRVDSKVVNKRLLESLIRCGAMDGFEENRNQLLHMYESAQAVGAKQQRMLLWDYESLW